MPVFLRSFALGLEDGRVPPFWLLIWNPQGAKRYSRIPDKKHAVVLIYRAAASPKKRSSPNLRHDSTWVLLSQLRVLGEDTSGFIQAS